jgi:tetratricopeptide (TPR) repeat protein
MNELAIDHWNAGLQVEPTFARAIFRMGRELELYRHEYKEALQCYERAHILKPDDREIEAYLVRLKERYPQRPFDIAWNLKDWLSGRAEAGETK